MDNINFVESDGSYNEETYSGNYISLMEFREAGYLQEINRTFLHPLGFAMEFGSNGENDIFLGILDKRKEGIQFDLENSSEDRNNRFNKRKDFIDSELERIATLRGFKIEKIQNNE